MPRGHYVAIGARVAALALAFAAAGCESLTGGSSPTRDLPSQPMRRDANSLPGTILADATAEAVERGFFGAVAGEEPRSVLIGRDVLIAGGSAADAAVAMYFALTATKPSAASIGAAGACMVYDPRQNKARALDFAAPVAQPAADGRPVVAPPLAPRAMFALHAAYGRLKWAQLVTPGESLARFGAPVSRSFARDLKAAEGELMQDPEARRVFGRRGAAPGTVDGTAPEGYDIGQYELAGTLSSIRQGGPGVLYAGSFARQILEGAERIGARLGQDELRDALPQFVDPLVLPVGAHRIGFLPGYDTMGPYQATLWGLLTARDRLEEAPVAERLHMIADADARAMADFTSALPESRSRLAGPDIVSAAHLQQLLAGYAPDRVTAVPSARPRRNDDSGTSIAVVDKDGGAVACGFTMYRPFGLGRLLPGTGFFPAVAPAPDLHAPALSPTLIWNENTKQLFFAGAGAGFGAPTAVVTTALQAVLGKFTLEVSMAIPRLHHPGAPKALIVEKEVGQDARGELAERGYKLEDVERFGPLNAVYCSEGLPRRPDTCSARADWRGAGLAIVPTK